MVTSPVEIGAKIAETYPSRKGKSRLLKKYSLYKKIPTPPIIEEQAPFRNTYMSRIEQKPWS
jgi:hypothetical protein